MAEETNTHLKVAMADVMGILVISMFTFAVGIWALGYDDGASLIGAVGPYVGVLCIITAIFMFWNENILGTAIFGPLAVFFLTITAGAPDAGGAAMLCVVIGIIALIDCLVSMAQPVKMLPILLGIAAIAFFITALHYAVNVDAVNNDYKFIVGALWMIYSLLSFYMGAAILLLVMKGKQILPLMIKS